MGLKPCSVAGTMGYSLVVTPPCYDELVSQRIRVEANGQSASKDWSALENSEGCRERKMGAAEGLGNIGKNMA